jgi:hypothetical protein
VVQAAHDLVDDRIDATTIIMNRRERGAAADDLS